MTSICGEIIPGHFEVAGCYMDVSENSGFSPQIIHFKKVFHYFHHPFWGTPIFGNTHMFFWLWHVFILRSWPSIPTETHTSPLKSHKDSQNFSHRTWKKPRNTSWHVSRRSQLLPKTMKSPWTSMVWRPLGFWGPASFQGLSSPNLQQSLKNGIKWPCLNDN